MLPNKSMRNVGGSARRRCRKARRAEATRLVTSRTRSVILVANRLTYSNVLVKDDVGEWDECKGGSYKRRCATREMDAEEKVALRAGEGAWISGVPTSRRA